MSVVEQAWCRSLPWRAFTRRLVFPWAIGSVDLQGDILELGSGSARHGRRVAGSLPAIRLTATDVDPEMRSAALRRLERFGARARVLGADATSLSFDDAATARLSR